MTANWLALTALAKTELSASGPLIGRRAGQILARHELDKVSIPERILRFLAKIFGVSANAVPSGWFGLAVLLVLLVLLVIIVLTWARPSSSRRLRAGAVLGDRSQTAREYRRRSAQLAASGQYGEAIVEGVRAIAAELEERSILAPRVGRTARELAIEAGRELPALASDLRSATGLFEDVRYGDRPGSQSGYELVRRVDVSVQAAQASVTSASEQADVGPAVPR